MSEAVAKKQLEEALAISSNVRADLNKNVHVVDISYTSLRAANKVDTSNTREFRQAYNQFIATLTSSIRKFINNLDQAINNVLTTKTGSVYYEDGTQRLLISTSFDAASSILRKVAIQIPNNKYFGTIVSGRNLDEVIREHGLKYIDDAKPTRVFLKSDGYLYKVVKHGKDNYTVEKQSSLGNYAYVAYKNNLTDKLYTIEPLSNKFDGQEVELVSGSTVSLTETTDGNVAVILKRLELQVFDIGHISNSSTQTGNTPALNKLFNAVEYALEAGGNVNILEKYIDRLDKLHSSVDYKFYNAVPDSDIGKSNKLGYLVVTLQHRDINNKLSIDEATILREFKVDLEKILFNISGSNTIKEDLVEVVKNSFTSKLGNASKALKKHKEVTGSIKIDPIKLNVDTKKVTGSKKTKVKKSTTPLRTLINRQYSLTSLQTLINANLQNVISANMGDGNRKDILNYRTGRFAASAQVQKLSLSRQGMITAFYTYMKYPYQTFEPGFAQGEPLSRNPRLLISQSIREIVATKVANRMRAVLL
jgi:hypothetical protein